MMAKILKYLLFATLTLLVGANLASCSDTNLYSPGQQPKQADRLALSGQVCADDPTTERFPTRVVMVVDRAVGPLYSSFDLASRRIDAMNDFARASLNRREVQMAVIGYAGRPQRLAPSEGNFTRNPGELFNAVNRLALSEGCLEENRCRDLREAMRATQALIEDDLASKSRGERALTQYAVVVVNAGMPSPLAVNNDCCGVEKVECAAENDNPSVRCEEQLATRSVAEMRESALDLGAGGLRLHAVQLAAEPEKSTNDDVQQIMEQMAFAGGGVFTRYNAPGGVSFNVQELLGTRQLLRPKLLIAANLNAVPGPTGPMVDSDADGLSDAEEDRVGTDKTTPDTDGDGITDLVETLVQLDPLTPDEATACEGIPVGLDTELDGLTDCDEELLGTDYSLVDSDGDAMPDKLEVISGTDYLNRDSETDADGDGVSNGDEISQRTDPRSTDTRYHLSFGHRYELEDSGLTTQLYSDPIDDLTGVSIVEFSEATSTGAGTIWWDADDETLRWKDPDDPHSGPRVRVDGPGRYELVSPRTFELPEGERRSVWVEVFPSTLPEESQTVDVRIRTRDRYCLNYTIRNIRLMETLERADGTPRGRNDVLVYFAETPPGRLESAGPFRLAQIPVVFDPPEQRDPDAAVLEVRNEEFVRPRLPQQ
jgi:hypothetical protein